MKILLILWCVLVVIGCQEKKGAGKGQLPSIDLLLTDSLTHINTKAVRKGNPVALLYFSPDCEHCQQETKSIIHHMNSLQEIHFYFITNDPLERAKVFISVFHLERYSNIIIGVDDRFQFPRVFNGAVPPYLVLYDSNLDLVHIFDGETEVGKIITLIKTL